MGTASVRRCFSTICLLGLEFLSLTMSTHMCPHDTGLGILEGNGNVLSLIAPLKCKCMFECKDVITERAEGGNRTQGSQHQGSFHKCCQGDDTQNKLYII